MGWCENPEVRETGRVNGKDRTRAGRSAPPFWGRGETDLTTKRAGQASIESAIALIGALLLLLGSVKVFFWITTRLIRRQQYYQCTRVEAGSDAAPGAWDDRATNEIPLKVFEKQPTGSDPWGISQFPCDELP